MLIPAAALAAAAVVALVGTTLAPAGGPAVSVCPAGVAGEESVPAPTQDPAAPVWADEFDGAADAPIDPTRWQVQTGGLGWGVGELQAYTDSPSNVSYSGEGELVLTARREPGAGGAEYTSARLSTCGTLEFTHGRVEARIALPRGQGLWPAFWLLGAQEPWPLHGEIDIVEAVNDMATADFNTHQPRPDGTDWERSASSAVHPSGSWAGEYHVFAVDWTSDALVWSVDGTEYATLSRADTPPDGAWVIDRSPQVVVLNLAVGGEYPGPPTANSPFPAEMRVDYVRVYENSDTQVSYRAR